MLEQGARPEDPSAIVYWDVSYFETCILARRARAKRGQPAVVPKGHRGTYIPVDESGKKRKSKNPPKLDPAALEGIDFTPAEAITMKGEKVNSVALFAAISGIEVLLA